MRWLQRENTKTWLVVGVVLTLLLLRAWQLRFPGLLGGLNEDEIHHNFWLINDQSVLGDFTVWQLQPLLDYITRLYFWFPLLRYGWWPFLILGGLGLAAVLGCRYLLSGRPEGSVEMRMLRLWLLACLAACIAGAVWVVLPERNPQTVVLLGLSANRLILLGAPILAGAVAVYGLVHPELFLERGRAALKKHGWFWLAGLALTNVLAWVWVLLPLTGMAEIPSRWGGVYARLTPVVTLTGVLAGLTAAALWALARPAGWRAAIAGLLVLTTAFGLLALKPASLHAGYTELMLQIPALFYSLLSVTLAYLLALATLHKLKVAAWVALAAAAIPALWVAYHPMEVALASLARHYSLITLVSLAWFWVYTFIDKPDARLLAGLSFLFGNTHSFAFPLILAAYVYFGISEFRSKGSKAAASRLLQWAGVMAAILLVNYAIAPYWFGIGGRASGLALREVLDRWGDLLARFLVYLQLPLVEWIPGEMEGALIVAAILLAGLTLAFVNQRSGIFSRLFFMGLAVPGTLLFVAFRPEYSFASRYFSPFFGYGFVLVLGLLAAGLGVLGSRQSSAPRRVLVIIAAGVLLLPFGAWKTVELASGLIADRETLTRPPANNSDRYRAYREIKDESSALFLWIDIPISVQRDIPLFYMEYTDGGYPHDFEMYGVRLGRDTSEEVFTLFLEEHPGGMVVFDGVLNGCSSEFLDELEITENLEPVRGIGACMWKLTGVESYSEMCELARITGFPGSGNGVFCE